VRLLRVNGSVSPSASSVSRKSNSSQAAMKKDKSLCNRSEMAVTSSADVVYPSSNFNRDVAVQFGGEDLMHNPIGIVPFLIFIFFLVTKHYNDIRSENYSRLNINGKKTKAQATNKIKLVNGKKI
jgi:hypothetical protein